MAQTMLAFVVAALVIAVMSRDQAPLAGGTDVEIGRAVAIDESDALTDPPIGAVVMVTALRCGSPSAGSGFVLGDDSIVTAGHVVEPGASMQVQGAFGYGETEPVRAASRSDLANGAWMGSAPDVALRLAGRDPVTGTEVMMLGIERTGRVAVTSGKITVRGKAADYGLSGADLYVVDAAVSPGHSGGPVVNRAGDVVGVIAAGESATATTLVTPVSELRSMLGRDLQGASLPTDC